LFTGVIANKVAFKTEVNVLKYNITPCDFDVLLLRAKPGIWMTLAVFIIKTVACHWIPVPLVL
jgi:hypothetical protein